MMLSLLLIIYCFVSCCIVTQAQAQKQQQQKPLQTNDILNDGIYVQSITLPSATTTNDDERSTNESSDINSRERLIMYDFKPAFPPYTKESLDKLLIIPPKDDNNVDVDKVEPPLVEEQMDDDDIDDGLVTNDGKINTDEVTDGGVVHHEDELNTSEEQEDNELQQQSNSDNDSSDDDVKVVDATNDVGDDEVIEDEESSTDSSTTNDKNNEATETTEIQQQDKLDEESDDSNHTVEEETNKSDTTEDDDDNDINMPPRPAGINEYDDTIYPESTPEEQHQPLTPTSSLPEEGDDAEQLDEVSTIEKEEEKVVVEDDDRIMSNDDAPEAGEEVIITLGDESVADEKNDDGENMPLTDESIVPQSNLEPEVKNDDKNGEEDDAKVNTANPNEDVQSATDTSEESTTTTQTNDAAVEDSTYQEEPKQEETSKQYDYNDDDTGSILNSNSNNKEANREFVDGLDEIDKLFEEVEVPDELDVGADGSSMQDVLVGQGLKIIWKRAKLVSKGIKSKVDDIATSVKGLYNKLQFNDGEDSEDNDLTIDSLLNMNNKPRDGNEVKLQSFKDTDHTNTIDDEENEDFPLVKSPQAKKIIKWSKRKLKQVRHILDDLLSIFGEEEEDDEDDLGDDFLVSRRQAMDIGGVQ